MPKKTTGTNRKKFLSKMREQLVEMKTKLLSEMDSELRAEREGNKDEGMDTYDLASEERDREINFILSDRERVKIKQIDDALGRMAEGSYGVCESCGDQIGSKRMMARPVTTFCINCKSEMEAEERREESMQQGQAESTL